MLFVMILFYKTVGIYYAYSMRLDLVLIYPQTLRLPP
jgi:hypothetical protein